MSDIIHNLFKVVSLFSLVFAGMGDVLAPRNPTKEMYTWKDKFEAIELRCSTLQNEFTALQEKVKVSNSVQKEAKIHDSH